MAEETGKLKIIESELCAARHNKLYEKFPRLAERLDGLYWNLERIGISELERHNVEKIADNVFVLQLSSWAPGGLPSMIVLFTYNEETGSIHIESSRIVESKK